VNATVAAALALYLAPRSDENPNGLDTSGQQDAPSPPFGYGTDIWCERDLDPSRDVDGQTMLALAQALVRRLDCPRGRMIDDPNYGIDLRAELNRGTTRAALDAMAARIMTELTKDDRVSFVQATVTPNTDGSTLRISIRVRAVDPRIGTFSLTLALTSTELLLEEMGRNA